MPFVRVSRGVVAVAGSLVMVACPADPPTGDAAQEAGPVVEVAAAKAAEPAKESAPPVQVEPVGPAVQAEPAAGRICDEELGDPVALFADNALIRLPKGVEMVEETPFFARASAKAITSTCGGVIDYVGIGYFQTDEKKSVTAARDETIRMRGLGAPRWSEETTNGRNYTGAFEVDAAPDNKQPVKGWFVMKEKRGLAFFAIFETHPDHWNALAQSFRASGKRFLVTGAGFVGTK